MRGPFLCLLLLLTSLGACGYRLSGAGPDSGRGRTLSVPVFMNRTTSYRIEQRLTSAVRREFVRRTHYRVLPDSGGDVALSAEVLTFSVIPILFNEQGRGSTYSISVDLKVAVTEAGSGRVLFKNDRWTFREVFELSQVSEDFVLEDGAALDRLSRRFASSLVASFINVRP